MNNDVCLVQRENCKYYVSEAFRPTVLYPESPFTDVENGDNQVYDMVRESFFRMGLDGENYGLSSWNPLKKYISPGDSVLIKPNLVMDYNRSGEGTDCLYTQPSVVSAVLDYVVIALQGEGHIIVGDAPMQECKFDKLAEESGYLRLIQYFKKKLPQGISIELVDFRAVTSVVQNNVHRYEEGEENASIIDLGQESAFSDYDDQKYKNMRITNYDPHILAEHHNQQKNEYCISNYILKADVIINMPKPKTHRKAGVTIALKNLVGINARKEYLPHHTNGAVQDGGDEFLHQSKLKLMKNRCYDKKNYYSQTKENYLAARLYGYVIKGINFLLRFSQKDDFYEGSWYGNDTISRTIVDLNRILFYADKDGNMTDEIQRKYLIVADMIISGEKEGPVAPSPKDTGLIAIGENPVSFDEGIAHLMGADVDRIPTLVQAKMKRKRYRLFDELQKTGCFVSNMKKWDGKTFGEVDEKELLYFEATSGWKAVFRKAKNKSSN